LPYTALQPHTKTCVWRLHTVDLHPVTNSLRVQRSYLLMQSSTHLLGHSLNISLTHLLARSVNCALLGQSSCWSSTCSTYHSLACSLTHSLTYSLTHSRTPSMYALTHPSTHEFAGLSHPFTGSRSFSTGMASHVASAAMHAVGLNSSKAGAHTADSGTIHCSVPCCYTINRSISQ